MKFSKYLYISLVKRYTFAYSGFDFSSIEGLMTDFNEPVSMSNFIVEFFITKNGKAAEKESGKNVFMLFMSFGLRKIFNSIKMLLSLFCVFIVVISIFSGPTSISII